MRYKRLPKAELEKLEKEFINFLAVNSITAADWIVLQENNDEKMDSLIDDFSDMVYHRVMQKVNYLDFRTKSEIKVLKAEKEKLILLGLISTNDKIDLTDESQFKALFVKGDDLSDMQIYKTEKNYTKERESEIFEMLENGCCIVDDSLFNFFEKLYEHV